MNERDDLTRRIIAHPHATTLIAAYAVETSTTPASKKGYVVRHDGEIAGPRIADAITEMQSVYGACRLIDRVPRLAQHHVDESLAPKAMKAGWVSVADVAFSFSKNSRRCGGR